MELFIDTANIDEIREASTWGFISGVTTNPSLIAKEGRKQEDVIREIASLIDGPISAEVTADDYEGMIEQALYLYSIKPENIVIKLPMTMAGLRACRTLYEKHIPTNVTLCFSVNQALLAMEAHATYVSPFIGRVDDMGEDGIDLIESIVTLKHANGYDTKIICASIRNPNHVASCALLGADVATVPYKYLVKMVKHPLTDAGLAIFEKDAEKTANLK